MKTERRVSVRKKCLCDKLGMRSIQKVVHYFLNIYVCRRPVSPNQLADQAATQSIHWLRIEHPETLFVGAQQMNSPIQILSLSPPPPFSLSPPLIYTHTPSLSRSLFSKPFIECEWEISKKGTQKMLATQPLNLLFIFSESALFFFASHKMLAIFIVTYWQQSLSFLWTSFRITLDTRPEHCSKFHLLRHHFYHTTSC